MYEDGAGVVSVCVLCATHHPRGREMNVCGQQPIRDDIYHHTHPGC